MTHDELGMLLVAVVGTIERYQNESLQAMIAAVKADFEAAMQRERAREDCEEV